MSDDRGGSATDKIVNRHMARLLFELEEAHCPQVYLDAVKSKLVWLRDDLNKVNDGGYERHERHGHSLP